MRDTVRKNGVTVRGYAGTTGVLLAFDIEEEKREGLLGFALERSVGPSRKMEWLTGSLQFQGVPSEAGKPTPTNEAPVQKFRWSDYRVLPETRYKFTVHPVYGTPEALQVEAGPTISLKTASSAKGDHCILFNRAAAASQAFSSRFREEAAELAQLKDKSKWQPSERVLEWLSRGVREQIVGFIDAAKDSTWALDIAIYEYELPEIIQAVDAAHQRGVNVRVVYHAKKGDEQTAENKHNLRGIPEKLTRPRVTQKICHHKFIVRSRMDGDTRRPEAVLCGSTNFTHNGVYRQGNVVHVVSRPEVAGQYLALFEILFRGDDPKKTRTFIGESNLIDETGALFVGFSPRSGGADLQSFVRLIQGAKRDVLFCTAFDLFDDIEDALLGEANDPILRYGLQNSRSRVTGFHADRTANFTATAMLSQGLEGFLKESTHGQRGNILIHTKMVVVDFTSDSPTVLSGSHNLSKAASEGNDENFLVSRGNTDIADSYGCELMRLYDHYRFRFRVRENPNAPAPLLTRDDRWTDRYFREGSLPCRDRVCFAGG